MRSLIRFFVAALLVSTAFAGSADAYPSIGTSSKYVPLPSISWAQPRPVTIEAIPMRKHRAVGRRLLPQWEAAKVRCPIASMEKAHSAPPTSVPRPTRLFDFKSIVAVNAK